jgi:hypothetical protein
LLSLGKCYRPSVSLPRLQAGTSFARRLLAVGGSLQLSPGFAPTFLSYRRQLLEENRKTTASHQTSTPLEVEEESKRSRLRPTIGWLDLILLLLPRRPSGPASKGGSGKGSERGRRKRRRVRARSSSLSLVFLFLTSIPLLTQATEGNSRRSFHRACVPRELISRGATRCHVLQSRSSDGASGESFALKRPSRLNDFENDFA